MGKQNNTWGGGGGIIQYRMYADTRIPVYYSPRTRQKNTGNVCGNVSRKHVHLCHCQALIGYHCTIVEGREITMKQIKIIHRVELFILISIVGV